MLADLHDPKNHVSPLSVAVRLHKFGVPIKMISLSLGVPDCRHTPCRSAAAGCARTAFRAASALRFEFKKKLWKKKQCARTEAARGSLQDVEDSVHRGVVLSHLGGKCLPGGVIEDRICGAHGQLSVAAAWSVSSLAPFR